MLNLMIRKQLRIGMQIIYMIGAMIQPLPVSDFKFLTKKEINKFNLDPVSENSEIDYILEVDLEYCKE